MQKKYEITVTTMRDISFLSYAKNLFGNIQNCLIYQSEKNLGYKNSKIEAELKLCDANYEKFPTFFKYRQVYILLSFKHFKRLLSHKR